MRMMYDDREWDIEFEATTSWSGIMAVREIEDGHNGPQLMSISVREKDFDDSAFVGMIIEAYTAGEAAGLAYGKSIGAREQLKRTHEILGIDRLITAIADYGNRE